MGSLRALAGSWHRYFFFYSERVPKTCFVAFVFYLCFLQFKSYRAPGSCFPLCTGFTKCMCICCIVLLLRWIFRRFDLWVSFLYSGCFGNVFVSPVAPVCLLAANIYPALFRFRIWTEMFGFWKVIFMSRILRCLVCFLLICCILVNLSPLKSYATGVGVASGIFSAAGVSVPALWPIVAALAVVGVTAYGIDSGAFKQVANSCYSALESAGTWINNGMTEILRTEDTDGNVQYYVPGAMLESVRSWLFHSGTVVNGPVFSESISGTYTTPSGNEYSLSAFANVPISYVSTVTKSNGVYSFKVYALSHVQDIVLNGNNCSLSWDSSFGCYVSLQKHVSIGKSLTGFSASFPVVGANCSSLSEYISSPYDVSLGYLPDRDTVLDDETIVAFHPYLAEVLRTRSGGSGGSGEDENKWWLAVAYAETLEKLYQTTQQAQIENPSVVEIPDLQEGTQYEVTVEEDEDGNKKYILNPIYDPGTNPGTGTDPGTGTNPGTGTDPDTGTDSGNGSGNNTGTDSGNPGSGGAGSAPSGTPSHFALGDLSKFFPFCIPFDLFDFFKLLNADPVAPEFSWTIQDLSGQSYSLTIDLSEWDSVAQLFRRLQLFLFVCGLAAASRKFIKW